MEGVSSVVRCKTVSIDMSFTLQFKVPLGLEKNIRVSGKATDPYQKPPTQKDKLFSRKNFFPNRATLENLKNLPETRIFFF